MLVIFSNNSIIAQDLQKPLKYIGTQELRIINKGWKNTIRKYDRLPSELKGSVRSALWRHSQCSSGIAIRFATNLSRVGIKHMDKY